jgi:hypothetical protein
LLTHLQRDLEPVGTLEELLVEKIAQEYWRLGVAAWHEAQAFSLDNPFGKPSVALILRYQMTINRQLFQAMNELERLQRLRRGTCASTSQPASIGRLADSLRERALRSKWIDDEIVLSNAHHSSVAY